MKSPLCRLLLQTVLVLACVLPANALITDPEDHVYYYSGLIAPNSTFQAPSFMSGEGWEFGCTNVDAGNNSRLLNFLGCSTGDDLYAIILDKETGYLVLDLPSCDSIFVEFWGTGQRGIKITNDKDSRYAWNAQEGNRPVNVGARFNIKEPVKITLTPTKLEMGVRPTGPLYISSIKIYCGIEESVIPVFDGNVAAWTFRYRPKETGTIDTASYIRESNQLEPDQYAKYASDLGVVRGMLTGSSALLLGYDPDLKDFPLRMTHLPVTPDNINPSEEEQHINYFDIQASTKGFWDLSLEFDFTIRDGSSLLWVLGRLEEETSWTLLQRFANPENPNQEMAHAKVTLPDTYRDAKKVHLRLMMGAGSHGGSAEMALAHLALKGYDDYYPSNADAVRLAYVTGAQDRVRVLKRSAGADSSDMLLPKLFADPAYNVSVVARDVWSALGGGDEVLRYFSDFDQVLVSPYVQADEDFMNHFRSVLNSKPVLLFDDGKPAEWFGLTPDAGSGDTYLVSDTAFYYHPLFAGLTLRRENGSLTLPSFIQSETEPVPVMKGLTGRMWGYSLGCGNPSGAVALWEINDTPQAKCLLINTGEDLYSRLNADGVKLVFNALSYLSKPTAFVRPDFNLDDKGAVVGNVAELSSALAYDYSPMGIDEVSIRLLPGRYPLTGTIFMPSDSRFELSPARSDDQPALMGSFTCGQLNLKSLTFSHLVFFPDNSQTAVMEFKEGDTVSEGLVFENCYIESVPALLRAAAVSNLTLNSIEIRGNRFQSVGGRMGFVSLLPDSLELKSVKVEENIFTDLQGDFIRLQNLQRGDNRFEVSVLHNTFIGSDPQPAPGLLSLDGSLIPESVSVDISDNIFCRSLGFMTVSLAGDSEKDATLRLANNLLIDAAIEVSSFGQWTEERRDLSLGDLRMRSLFESEDSQLISKLEAAYTAGTDRTPLGARASYAERRAPAVIRVASVPELSTALSIAYNGDIIELEDNRSDSLGVYQLGSQGFVYPTKGGRLTLRAAERHQPVLFGNLAPSNADANLDDLLVKGLCWQEPDVTYQSETRIQGYNSTAYSPFYFTVAGGRISHLHISGCRFVNLENQMIVRTDKCKGLVLDTVRVDYCEFDNLGGRLADGVVGAHFFQFNADNTYTLNRFLFVENVVKNFHGSQFFNISRAGNPGDSVMVVDIVNNVFYRVGGNAPRTPSATERNFLEFTRTPVGYDVQIRIDNNIFWQRWSDVNYPLARLSLFDPTGTQSVRVEVLRNYYDGEYYTSDETYGANPVAATDEPYTDNLLASGLPDALIERDEPLYWENCEEMTLDPTSMSVGRHTVFYTMGLPSYYLPDERYIGAGICYDVVNAVETADTEPLASVYVKNGRVFVQVAEEADLEVYDLGGRRIHALRAEPGLQCLDGLPNGLFLIRVGRETTKVLIR